MVLLGFGRFFSVWDLVLGGSRRFVLLFFLGFGSFFRFLRLFLEIEVEFCFYFLFGCIRKIEMGRGLEVGDVIFFIFIFFVGDVFGDGGAWFLGVVVGRRVVEDSFRSFLKYILGFDGICSCDF